MKKLDVQIMEKIYGGVSRNERNVGCGALGLAAGISAGLNPIVGGLTTLGCMLVTSFD